MVSQETISYMYTNNTHTHMHTQRETYKLTTIIYVVHVHQGIVNKMYRSIMYDYIPRVLSPALISVDIVGLVSNGNVVAAASEIGWLLSCCAGENIQ